MNCLGCEYEVVEGLAKDNLLESVGVVEFLSFLSLDDDELDRCMVTSDLPDPNLMLQEALPKSHECLFLNLVRLFKSLGRFVLCRRV